MRVHKLNTRVRRCKRDRKYIEFRAADRYMYVYVQGCPRDRFARIAGRGTWRTPSEKLYDKITKELADQLSRVEQRTMSRSLEA